MFQKVSNAHRLSKGLSTIFFALTLFSCDKMNPQDKSQELAVTLPNPSQELTTMTLFYPRTDGAGFIKIENQVANVKKTPSAWLNQMIEQLSRSPNAQSLAVFPQHVDVYSLFSENEMLYLDFSQTIQKSFFSDIQMEQLSFDAFLSTLKANFPFAKQVKFLVEHEDSDVIWGHIYARQPFSL